jgi:putative ABC transport system ATP-binding protein
LDEPTGDLDTKNSDLIMKIIVDLNVKDGITILMVTHDTFLKNFGTRTIRMLDGKINKIEVFI